MQEEILVIPRKVLGSNASFRGFREERDAVFWKCLSTASFFKERESVEFDPCYKQLIVYMIVKSHNKLFLYQRIEGSGEKRLVDKYSFGLGGHINPAYTTDFRSLITFNLNRELKEEISFQGPYSYRFLGLVNDEESGVGKYHLGLVFLVSCSSPVITVREKDKLRGQLVSVTELEPYRPSLETWSALLLPQLDHLKEVSFPTAGN